MPFHAASPDANDRDATGQTDKEPHELLPDKKPRFRPPTRHRTLQTISFSTANGDAAADNCCTARQAAGRLQLTAAAGTILG